MEFTRPDDERPLLTQEGLRAMGVGEPPKPQYVIGADPGQLGAEATAVFDRLYGEVLKPRPETVTVPAYPLNDDDVVYRSREPADPQSDRPSVWHETCHHCGEQREKGSYVECCSAARLAALGQHIKAVVGPLADSREVPSEPTPPPRVLTAEEKRTEREEAWLEDTRKRFPALAKRVEAALEVGAHFLALDGEARDCRTLKDIRATRPPSNALECMALERAWRRQWTDRVKGKPELGLAEVAAESFMRGWLK